MNNTCKLSEDFESKMPEEYVKVSVSSKVEGYYFASQEQLPWPQAQYECQSRHGHLAEVTGTIICW